MQQAHGFHSHRFTARIRPTDDKYALLAIECDIEGYGSFIAVLVFKIQQRVVCFYKLQARMRAEARHCCIHINSQQGLCTYIIINTRKLEIRFELRCINSSIPCRLLQDTLYLPPLGMLQGKNLVIELYGFFRLYENGFLRIALAMQYAFCYAFILCLYRSRAPAVMKTLSNIGKVTGFVEAAQHTVKSLSRFVPHLTQLRAYAHKLRRCVVSHITLLINNGEDSVGDLLFVSDMCTQRLQCREKIGLLFKPLQYIADIQR